MKITLLILAGIGIIFLLSWFKDRKVIIINSSGQEESVSLSSLKTGDLYVDYDRQYRSYVLAQVEDGRDSILFQHQNQKTAIKALKTKKALH